MSFHYTLSVLVLRWITSENYMVNCKCACPFIIHYQSCAYAEKKNRNLFSVEIKKIMVNCECACSFIKHYPYCVQPWKTINTITIINIQTFNTVVSKLWLLKHSAKVLRPIWIHPSVTVIVKCDKILRSPLAR